MNAQVMGWSGYNALMQGSGKCDKAGAGGYNETTFVATMDFLVNSGLAKLGFTYLAADDCWIADTRDPTTNRLRADPTRFPSGMTYLADQAHSRGLQLGLYAAAGKLTCRDFPGSEGFEQLDADTFVSWGVDGVKLDACDDTALWGPQYTKWSQALNTSGKAMFFSCSWPAYFQECIVGNTSSCGESPWPYIASICNMWRYGDDLQPTWTRGRNTHTGGSGLSDIIEWAAADDFAHKAPIGPGAYNDPDFLIVGCPPDSPCEPGYSPGPPINDVEQRTQFSMWSILAAPMILGSDIRYLSSYALETVSNADVIAVSQDPAGHQGLRIVNGTDGGQVWVRNLTAATSEQRAVAVAMFNSGDAATLTMSVTAQQLGFVAGAQLTVKDLWSKTVETVGGDDSAASPISRAVATHATAMLRVSSAT